MKLKVRRFSEIDISTRVNWINDLRINENMSFELPATIEKTFVWHNKNINNSSRIDFTVLNEYTVVSMGGYTFINETDSNAEFYIMVNPGMLGQGIGSKVSMWLFNYAFIVMKLNKIYLYTNEDNTHAYRIYEKCGFKLEGVLREHKYKNGYYKNRLFYGLLRSEWENLAWAQKKIDYEF